MILRPEILTHPTIPEPLHGVNPRSIEGSSWWDKTRKEIYAQKGYRCWACGMSASQSGRRKALDAHECYTVDYEEGVAEFKEIVALCVYCHHFIHSDRLYRVYMSGKMEKNAVLDVLNHGFDILTCASLSPSRQAVIVRCMVNGLSQPEALQHCKKLGYTIPKQAPWHTWCLHYKGQSYAPKFPTRGAWKEYYHC